MKNNNQNALSKSGRLPDLRVHFALLTIIFLEGILNSDFPA